MKRLFAGQLAHLIWLLTLLAGLWVLSRRLPGFSEGGLFGLPTAGWVWVTLGVTIGHQVYVWICWRLELDGKRLTRLSGAAAFPVYAAGFTLLILGRPIALVCLALANSGTLPVNRSLTSALAVLVAVPAAYTFYSVKRYFGFKRAYGIDHFDTSYRSGSLVKRGIFRFTSNAMYTYGLLVLWIPGLVWSSSAAVALAAFSHAYIWVHYFCTEKPDMERIYGSA